MAMAGGQKTSVLKRKGLVLWLTGLTVLYQAIYHVFMMRALQQEAVQDECAQQGQGQNRASGSPHCLEVQLFRAWQQQAPRTEVLGPEIGLDAERLGVESEEEGEELQELLLRRLSQTTAAPPEATTLPPSPGADGYPRVHAQFEAQRRALLEGHLKQEEGLLSKLQASNLSDTQGDLATWSLELSDLRQHLAAQEFQTVVADLQNSSAPLRQAEAKDVAVADLSSSRPPSQREAPEAKSSPKDPAASQPQQSHKEWEAEFVGRAQQYLRELCSEPERRGSKACVEALSPKKELKPKAPTVEERLAAAGNDTAAWSQTFKIVVREAQREMCQEPHRRDRSDCVELMSSIAKEEQKEQQAKKEASTPSGSAAQSHKEWEAEFVGRAQQYLRELCNEPERRGSKACVKVLSPESRHELETTGTVEERLAAAGSDSAAWSRTFKTVVRDAQREMCQEPHRVNRSDCIELMAAIAKEEQAEASGAQARQQQQQAQQPKGEGLPTLEERLAAAGGDSALWSRTFKAAVRDTQREMCQEPHRKGREECVELLTSIAEAEKREREEERASKHAASEARRSNLSAELAQWDAKFQQLSLDSVARSRDFMRKVRVAQRELCQEPQRRGRADCVELMASIAEAERREREEERASRRAAQESRRSAERAELAEWDAKFRQLKLDSAARSRDFARRVRAEQRELCLEAQRRGRPDCVELLASIAETEAREAQEEGRPGQISSSASPAPESTGASGGVTSLRQGRRQLDWSVVATRHSEGWLSKRLSSFRRRGPLLLDRADLLKEAVWVGKVPRVACVTAFQSGEDAAIRMKYLVERFHKQTYEGHSQLILVHHYKDEEAAELARLYADGKRVKAVAARGDEPFPSGPALRYGAWSADNAQVIVHWGFKEFHRYQRLSLQVRAIADSGRPGCLLRESGDEEGGLREETFAGEAKWMETAWHPFWEEQRAMVKGMLEDQIVTVDMAVGALPAGPGA